jgi:hypothetical protein
MWRQIFNIRNVRIFLWISLWSKLFCDMVPLFPLVWPVPLFRIVYSGQTKIIILKLFVREERMFTWTQCWRLPSSGSSSPPARYSLQVSADIAGLISWNCRLDQLKLQARVADTAGWISWHCRLDHLTLQAGSADTAGWISWHCWLD